LSSKLVVCKRGGGPEITFIAIFILLLNDFTKSFICYMRCALPFPVCSDLFTVFPVALLRRHRGFVLAAILPHQCHVLWRGHQHLRLPLPRQPESLSALVLVQPSHLPRVRHVQRVWQHRRLFRFDDDLSFVLCDAEIPPEKRPDQRLCQHLPGACWTGDGRSDRFLQV